MERELLYLEQYLLHLKRVLLHLEQELDQMKKMSLQVEILELHLKEQFLQMEILEDHLKEEFLQNEILELHLKRVFLQIEMLELHLKRGFLQLKQYFFHMDKVLLKMIRELDQLERVLLQMARVLLQKIGKPEQMKRGRRRLEREFSIVRGEDGLPGRHRRENWGGRKQKEKNGKCFRVGANLPLLSGQKRRKSRRGTTWLPRTLPLIHPVTVAAILAVRGRTG